MILSGYDQIHNDYNLKHNNAVEPGLTIQNLWQQLNYIGTEAGYIDHIGLGQLVE